MDYNMSLITDSGGSIGSIIDASNSYTNGFLTGAFLIMLFFVFMMIMKRWEFEKAFAASSFMCFMLGVILKSGGWVNLHFVLAFFILTALSLLYLTFVNRQQT